jgi:hypothetical protein
LYADGSEYIGQWKAGNMDGHGRLTYADGRQYVGEFKNDVRDGQGKMRFPDGNEYIGQWKAGNMDGRGKITFADGREHVGYFKEGRISDITENVNYLMSPVGNDIIEHQKIVLAISNSKEDSPIIKDKYEHDPFGRSKTYLETTLRCRHRIQLINKRTVAYKNPFTTVIGFTVYRKDGSNLTLQGNLGMSNPNEKIVSPSARPVIEFVSLSLKKFPSRDEANKWLDSGGCELDKDSIESVTSNVMGMVMFKDQTEWAPLRNHLYAL